MSVFGDFSSPTTDLVSRVQQAVARRLQQIVQPTQPGGRFGTEPVPGGFESPTPPPTAPPTAPGERDLQGQDLTTRAPAEGRPLFGPPGTNPAFGPGPTSLLDRIFPGYSQRAESASGARQAAIERRASFAPTPFGDLLAAGDPFAMNAAQGRAESAGRGVRMDALLEEMLQQMLGDGMDPGNPPVGTPNLLG